MIRLLKKIFGLCANPGCIHPAKDLIVLKDSKGKLREVQLCYSCTWKLLGGGNEWDEI